MGNANRLMDLESYPQAGLIQTAKERDFQGSKNIFFVLLALSAKKAVYFS